MKSIQSKTARCVALALCGLLAAGPVLADKPSWAGGGKHDRYEDNDRGDRGDRRGGDEHGHGKHGGGDHGDRGGRNWHEGDRYFNDDNRAYLREYYAAGIPAVVALLASPRSTTAACLPDKPVSGPSANRCLAA